MANKRAKTTSSSSDSEATAAPAAAAPDAEDLEAVKKELMNLVQAYEGGLSESELSRTMSGTSIGSRLSAVNALTDEGKIQLCKRGSELYYRAVDAKSSANHSALRDSNISIEERAVYAVVESAGSKGIWNREIRNQTKLPLNQMSKVLKQLETKKLIKAVKSVTASKRKLYMLYGIEPDRSVTGGAWYSGTEFESEYVQVLHEQCHQFVERRFQAAREKNPNKDFVQIRDDSLVSSAEVKDFIESSGISNVKLSLQEIETVLETIVFDGLIEKITVVSGDAVVDPAKDGVPDADVVSSAAPKSTASTKTTFDRSFSSDEEDAGGDANGSRRHVTNYYRVLAPPIESTGVMRTPCGVCPYLNECRPGAVINPANCLYLERWF